MSEGHFTIPVRIYLTDAQRAKLFHLLEGRGQELDDWLTELAAAQLATLPEAPPQPAGQGADPVAAELRRRRAELRRLRPRLADPFNPPPAWLIQLVADLEAEVARLEARMKDEG